MCLALVTPAPNPELQRAPRVSGFMLLRECLDWAAPGPSEVMATARPGAMRRVSE